jgi:hypothetical protein
MGKELKLMGKELSIVEQAELHRQEGLDMLAVGKAYPDTKNVLFKGEKQFISNKVTTSNFKGIEFANDPSSRMSQSLVSARLWASVKRPGRPAIKVYSEVLYGFSVGHLINLVNDLSPKKIMDKIGHVLKIQESPRVVPQQILNPDMNYTARS